MSIHSENFRDRILQGDALEVLQTLESGIFDCCVTSPPYYGLRDYGVPGQMGLENSLEEYVDKLVAVFRELRRTLREDGTLWLNLGDSYAGKDGCGNAPTNTRNKHGHTAKNIPPGLKAKDMMGIPWRVAVALREDGWYLRQDIIWSKPNPMPESVRDRCTKSHEYLFLLSRSPRYHYDQEAIAEPVAGSTADRLAQNVAVQAGSLRVPGKTNGPMRAAAPRFPGKGNNRSFRGGGVYTAGRSFHNSGSVQRESHGNVPNPTGLRNKRSVWTVATRGYSGAHFATFPPDLIRPCIRAGSRRGGLVVDPFFGSGTTGEVALQEGRHFVGIELNPAYITLSEERLEPYLLQTML